MKSERLQLKQALEESITLEAQIPPDIPPPARSRERRSNSAAPRGRKRQRASNKPPSPAPSPAASGASPEHPSARSPTPPPPNSESEPPIQETPPPARGPAKLRNKGRQTKSVEDFVHENPAPALPPTDPPISKDTIQEDSEKIPTKQSKKQRQSNELNENPKPRITRKKPSSSSFSSVTTATVDDAITQAEQQDEGLSIDAAETSAVPRMKRTHKRSETQEPPPHSADVIFGNSPWTADSTTTTQTQAQQQAHVSVIPLKASSVQMREKEKTMEEQWQALQEETTHRLDESILFRLHKSRRFEPVKPDSSGSFFTICADDSFPADVGVPVANSTAHGYNRWVVGWESDDEEKQGPIPMLSSELRELRLPERPLSWFGVRATEKVPLSAAASPAPTTSKSPIKPEPVHSFSRDNGLRRTEQHSDSSRIIFMNIPKVVTEQLVLSKMRDFGCTSTHQSARQHKSNPDKPAPTTYLFFVTMKTAEEANEVISRFDAKYYSDIFGDICRDHNFKCSVGHVKRK